MDHASWLHVAILLILCFTLISRLLNYSDELKKYVHILWTVGKLVRAYQCSVARFLTSLPLNDNEILLIKRCLVTETNLIESKPCARPWQLAAYSILMRLLPSSSEEACYYKSQWIWLKLKGNDNNSNTQSWYGESFGEMKDTFWLLDATICCLLFDCYYYMLPTFSSTRSLLDCDVERTLTLLLY